jgi:3-phosphoshikimate 1-carboxyvinyltransferase
MSKMACIYPLEQPIEARVTVPGSKSITNRALIIAALANGITTLKGASDANDSVILIRLLKKLGVDVQANEDTLTVNGNGGRFKSFTGELDVEDAGTVMRFLSALCCIIPGEIILKGSERMHQRPIHGLADALKQTGVKIAYLDKEGFPPIKIKGGDFKGGAIHVDASLSSQFVSALLMIAPVLPTDTEIICDGEMVSLPYIDMTIAVMKSFGVDIKHEDHKRYFIKGNQQYKGREYEIEGDASSASYLLALAAISGSTVEVTNLSSESMQSDARFADILGNMGCVVNKGKSISVTGTPRLKGVEVDMNGMPDTAQTLSIVAAFAKGETLITGLSTLQHKETNRLKALRMELSKLHINCKADDESIRITGGNPKSAFISTYNDHRMAMAFAIVGARIEVSIYSPDVVKKSFPGYWNTLKSMGVNVELE